MKKIVFLVLGCFLVTGCSSDYELKVNKYSMEENVEFTLKDDDYDKANLINGLFKISDINYDNENEMGRFVIDKLRNDKLSPGDNLEGFYNKEKRNNKISLSYIYKNDDYNSSYIFNNCFGDIYYDSTDDYYVINGYNSFKCLIKDKVSVSIKSDYRVIDNNADKIRGNEYIWYFDRKNNINHDLYIQISKEYMAPKSNYWGIIIFFVIIIGFVIYKFFIKKDSINFWKNNEV